MHKKKGCRRRGMRAFCDITRGLLAEVYVLTRASVVEKSFFLHKTWPLNKLTITTVTCLHCRFVCLDHMPLPLRKGDAKAKAAESERNILDFWIAGHQISRSSWRSWFFCIHLILFFVCVLLLQHISLLYLIALMVIVDLFYAFCTVGC